MKHDEPLAFGDIVSTRQSQAIMVVQPKVRRPDFSPGWFSGMLLTPQKGLRRNSVGQIAQYSRAAVKKVG